SEAQTPTLGPEGHGDVALLNPMSRQESHLRRDRLTGLLSHVERNLARGVRDVRLFELGTAFAPSDPRPLESPRVAVTLTGRATPVHWSGQARPYDVFDIGHVLDLIRGLVYPQGEIRPGTGGAKVLKEGAAYELRGPGGQTLGWAGVVEAHVLDLPPWAGQVLGLEVVLPDEPAPSVTVAADPPPSHPASGRDLAFLVPDHVEAGTVTAAIRAGGGDLLESVGIFDVYRGPDLPDGMRSVAYGLSFRGKDRTLTDEDVDEAVSGILRSVQEMTGVQPRV
ncbi:MAG: hypothetical protein OEO23_02535, partial [Gemmatimonadota bacterium]|nr:hypothetical protein [Gemmatimonadota bacterium]